MRDALANIEKLVSEVAKSAAKGETIPPEKLDVLKLLQPYYAIFKRVDMKSPDDGSDDEPTMDELRERALAVQENGRLQAPGRQRRRSISDKSASRQ
jgi:hypothetical protein